MNTQEIAIFLGVALPADFSLPPNADVRGLLKSDMEVLMLERAPFFFVERAVVVTNSVNGDVTVWGIVTMNEERSAGHFPGKPVVPLIELCKAMAQTGIIVVAFKGNDDSRVPIAIGSGDSKAIARDLIRAPTAVLIEAKLVSMPAFLQFKSLFAGSKIRRFLRRVYFVDAVAYKDGEPIGSLETIQYILLPKKMVLR